IDPQDDAAFYNRGNAHREKGDLDRAISDYGQAIQRDPDHPHAYNARGQVRFFAGRFDDATADFARAVQQQPDEPYSALWLYLAHARSDAAVARRELEINATKFQRMWPYPVAELLLGWRTPAVTLAAAGNNDGRCEAQFYIGEWHLLRGSRAQAAAALQIAADTCPKGFVEFAGAQAELQRLNA